MAVKRTIFLVVAAISIVAIAYLAHDGTSASTSTRPTSEAAQQHNQADVTPSETLSSRAPGEGQRAELGAPRSELFQHYACRATPDACRDDPLVAATPEEAVWMQARGYPTADQIDAARAFSADQLHREADRTGAPVDASLYAQALLRERQHREAFGELVQSFSQDGNIYALYLLSDIYQNAHDMKNRPLAMTYLRLAYLAGDHKAGVVFAMRYGDAHPQELAAADMQAAHFRRQMAPGGSWPRP